MKRLISKAQAEISIKKSRFISIAYPVNTLEEVKEKVVLTRKLYSDATHVVHAAVVGKSGTLFSSSDDREPKNTAGRPALEVLRGSGITNICVCIIRYFGGTLLGTGGLVKAYGESVKEVLKIVETEENIDYIHFTLSLDYDLYTPIRNLMEKQGAKNISEEFTTAILITCDIPLINRISFEKEVMDWGQGRIRIKKDEASSAD